MKRLISAAALGLLLAAPAAAAPMVFFGEDLSPGGTVPAGGNAANARADFLGQLTLGVSTEDFEAFADGTGAPLALSFNGGLGTIDASLTGQGEIERDLPSAGRFATSGGGIWEVSGTFEILFNSAIAAFGFYGTDIGDFDGNITVQTFSGSDLVGEFVIDNTLNGPSGSLLFWGLIDVVNPFTRVVFGNTNSGTDFFGFDDLTVGDIAQVQAVPLPAALPLYAGGLAVAGAFGWRKRRKATSATA